MDEDKSQLEIKFAIYPAHSDGLYYYEIRQSRDFPNECLDLVYYEEDKDNKWVENNYFTFDISDVENLITALRTTVDFMKRSEQ